MKKRGLLSIYFILLIFLSMGFIFSCEICNSPLNLEETIERSDLIIIGEKIGDGSYNSECKDFDYWNIKVKGVLLGNYDSDRIRIKNCYGSCSYGKEFFFGEYVLFLNNVDKDLANQVEAGCAVNNLRFYKEMIYYNEDRISLDSFLDRLGDRANREIIKETGYDLTLFYVMGVIIVLSIILFIFKVLLGKLTSNW